MELHGDTQVKNIVYIISILHFHCFIIDIKRSYSALLILQLTKMGQGSYSNVRQSLEKKTEKQE